VANSKRHAIVSNGNATISELEAEGASGVAVDSTVSALHSSVASSASAVNATVNSTVNSTVTKTTMGRVVELVDVSFQMVQICFEVVHQPKDMIGVTMIMTVKAQVGTCEDFLEVMKQLVRTP
jgi:hypothetical protein